MPGGDKMGPRGFGPMTDRPVAYCAGYNALGFGRCGYGRGSGGGRGRGGGYRRGNRFRAKGLSAWRSEASAEFSSASSLPAEGPMQEDELAALKGQAEYFEKMLKDIRQRLEAFEAENRRS